MQGQVIKRRYAVNETTPKFVLVQLNTYSNRLKAYRKANNTAYEKLVIKDAEEVRKKMIMDFNDNFSFCDYYFYYDTNAILIMEKQFAGILFDKNLAPVPTTAIKQYDTVYRIITWSINTATAQEYNEGTNPKDIYDANYSIGTQTLRLTVLMPDYKRVKHPEPDGLELISAGKSKQKVSAYKYNSPRFNIYYKARAKQLSRSMEDFFRADAQ